jgi:hypothetical protein
MKTAIFAITLLLFVLGGIPGGYAADALEESQVGFVVELQDGSRIRGTTHLDSLRLSNSAIGATEVPIGKVRRVTFPDGQKAPKVFLTNGDVLTGALSISELEMQTLFGAIAIPLEVVKSLEMSAVSSLIAQYSFNGDAHDNSGNEINGTIHGATLCEDRHGNKDSAYQFDGVNDYIKFGQDVPDMKEMTICAWVFAENNVAWLNDGDWANGNDVTLRVGPSSVTIRADKEGHSLRDKLDVGVEMQHQWRHIAWTMTSEQSNIYLDGSHSARVEKGGSNVSFHNLMLATSEYPQGSIGWNGYWKGKISSLRIYSRVLSGEEIREIRDSDD